MDNPLPNFDAAFAVWPDPVLVVDSEGLLQYLSPKAEQTLHWNIADCQGNFAHDRLCVNAREHMHPWESCPFNRRCEQMDWQSEFWCTGLGDYLSVDIRATRLEGQYRGFTAWSFVDNSARSFNSAELHKFAHFVELSPAPIAEFDSDGQMLFANSAMHELLLEGGFSTEGRPNILPDGLELECRALTAARPNDPPGAQQQLITLDAVTGSDDATPRLLLVEHSGRSIKWHLLALPAETYATPVKSVLAFAFDVTHQRKAQADIEEARRAARRDFYAKMIHELRTPLNAILGFSDLLLSRASAKLTPREQKNLLAINNAGFQLNELVTDTLDISKIEAGYMALEVAEFDMADLCESFWPQISALAGAKHLTLDKSVPADSVVLSDRKKVRQILINLLSNAIKYTQRGEVHLTVKRLPAAIQLLVTDTGVGIPEAQKHKLFNPYSQIDEQQNNGIAGTGLGLALVGELVKLLQGQITVDSEHQKGSVFTVTLPLALDHPSHSDD
ncbi:MAG TPA: PAS domain-containing sensor histidine kinase [Marinagarivorans sp.]